MVDPKETEKAKPGFGSRFLTNEADVWTQNAWDHVRPPPSHTAQIMQSLERQKKNPVPEDEKGKVNDKPAKHWDNFYKTNSNHFFRDRKWLCQEFGELAEALKAGYGEVTIVEFGCGAGNTLFPLLQMNENRQLIYKAYDYSSHGIKLIQTNPHITSVNATASVWDLTLPTLPNSLLPNSADIVLLIFVLSALNPSEWTQALTNIRRVLKQGGKVCIRDYGRYDLAQLRFREKRWLGENFYVRGDKTRVYFFDLDDLSILFTGAAAPPESYILKSSSDSPLIEDEDEGESTASAPDDRSDGAEASANLNAPNLSTNRDLQLDADTDTYPSSQPLPLPDPSPTTSPPSTSMATPLLPPDPTLPSQLPDSHPLFKSVQLGTDRRLLINRKRKLKMYRVWVQGVFEKL